MSLSKIYIVTLSYCPLCKRRLADHNYDEWIDLVDKMYRAFHFKTKIKLHPNIRWMETTFKRVSEAAGISDLWFNDICDACWFVACFERLSNSGRFTKIRRPKRPEKIKTGSRRLYQYDWVYLETSGTTRQAESHRRKQASKLGPWAPVYDALLQLRNIRKEKYGRVKNNQ